MRRGRGGGGCWSHLYWITIVVGSLRRFGKNGKISGAKTDGGQPRHVCLHGKSRGGERGLKV